MAAVTKRGDRWQIRIKHKLLPRPHFATYPTEAEATDAAARLEATLAAGAIPLELLPRSGNEADPLLVEIVTSYAKLAPITRSDAALIDTILPELVLVRRRGLTFGWVESYVRDLKLKRNVAPSTIRKRIGLLGRVVHWHDARTAQEGAQMPANAFRLLPVGYSGYTSAEASTLRSGGFEPKRDRQRNRRLSKDELERIRCALAGIKRPDRERPWPADPDIVMLFDLILNTGLRLFEAYRLRVADVDLERRLIHAQGSKGSRGAARPRMVPMGPALTSALREYMPARELVFPFWSGDDADRARCASRLSQRFATLFSYAGVEDFTEHDLRHEATCRWVTMRDRGGRWLWSDAEVCRIMGWGDTRMMIRYASLRGEDLSGRMG